MRLTGPNVAKLSLPPGKTEMLVFDDALAGFGVRLRAGGKRVWVAQYRVGAKQRRITIGNVEAIGADRARAAAKDILASVQLGSDPQAAKAAEKARAAVTLGAVVDRYVEGPAAKKLRPNSLVSLTLHLKKHWKPLHGSALHKLTRADVAARLGTIAAENGPYAANRSRASLSAMFAWAVREGLVEQNPVVGTNKATDEISRDRVLTDDELALVWANAGTGDYGRILRLLILTGQRREEVSGLRWSEVNDAKALWVLPKERSKNRLAHEIPLSAAALAIVQATPKREKRDLLFGDGAGSFSGWSKSKAALDARIAAAVATGAEEAKARGANSAPEPMSPWRIHDLRRTAATRMADLGVLPHVIESVLNHVSGHRAGISGVYNRATYSAEKRSALERWAGHVAELAG